MYVVEDIHIRKILLELKGKFVEMRELDKSYMVRKAIEDILQNVMYFPQKDIEREAHISRESNGEMRL